MAYEQIWLYILLLSLFPVQSQCFIPEGKDRRKASPQAATVTPYLGRWCLEIVPAHRNEVPAVVA